MRENCKSGSMRGNWKRGVGYRASSLLYAFAFAFAFAFDFAFDFSPPFHNKLFRAAKKFLGARLCFPSSRFLRRGKPQCPSAKETLANPGGGERLRSGLSRYALSWKSPKLVSFVNHREKTGRNQASPVIPITQPPEGPRGKNQ